MLCWMTILGGALIMMGNTIVPKPCFITSAWKIRLQRLTCCGSSISTSALPSCGKS